MNTHLRRRWTALTTPAFIAVICVGLAGCSGAVSRTDQNPDEAARLAGHPDLTVELTVSESTLSPGAQFTLSATVKNVGGGAAAATMLSYYRSDDATITTDDTPEGTDEIAALAADQSAGESTELTAPTTFGTYYYGACVDAVTGETEQANNCSAAVGITVTDSESDTPGAGLEPAPTPDESTRPLPMIRVEDERATEGVDPEFVFRVTLDEASSGLVTVRYATEDISALAGSDYHETSGTLTFAAGEVDKAVRVRIIDDSVEDSNETMKLVLSNPIGAQLADGEAIGTILNTEPADDYASNIRTTGTVSVGSSQTGALESMSDRDWIKVILVGGTPYVIHYEGAETGQGTLWDPYLHGVYDSNGDHVPGTRNDNGGHGLNSRIDFTPDTSGTYFLGLGTTSPSLTGTYRVAVGEFDPAASGDADVGVADCRDVTATTVTVGGSAGGHIRRTSEVDWFDVVLVAGNTYRVDIKGKWTENGTLRDTRIATICNPSGDLIDGTGNDNSGRDLEASITFDAPTGGTYHIGATVGKYSLLSTGTYKVYVTQVGPDDYYPVGRSDPGSGVPGSVSVGSHADGEIERPGDVDHFEVTLTGNTPYEFYLRGRGSGRPLYFEAILGVYDSNGLFTDAYSDAFVQDCAWIPFFATQDGTYSIAVGTEEGTPHTGNYRILVRVADSTTPGKDCLG